MVMQFLFIDNDSNEGSSAPKTVNEEKKEVEEGELEEEEEEGGGEEEEVEEQEDEGDEGEDGQGTESGEERKQLRLGAVTDRTESRSYGSVTHKCEVRTACLFMCVVTLHTVNKHGNYRLESFFMIYSLLEDLLF